jgi:PAS domain S-box-containing protein
MKSDGKPRITKKGKVKEKSQALASRESELRYRSLLDLAGDAILVADAETGVFVEANPKAEELLGRSRTQILGIHFLQLHPPEQADHYRRLFEWGLEHPGTVLGSELCVVHRDGHQIPV